MQELSGAQIKFGKSVISVSFLLHYPQIVKYYVLKQRANLAEWLHLQEYGRYYGALANT